MADHDFDPIRPVENLSNVPGLTPAGPRQERKRRQTPGTPGRPPQKAPREKAVEEPTPRVESDSHRIDYRA